MRNKEQAIVYLCQDKYLIGIIHQPILPSKTGVLIVVGGPQYRAGSHRQFVLLARKLCDDGIPVMRFDYRGMGDSDGESQSFQTIDYDISTTINTFFLHCPKLSGVIIWGLCDAASAALFYGYQDPRVKGLVLLNPWVYTEQGAAKTYLRYYYIQRITNPDFWRKIITFEFNYFESLTSVTTLIRKSIRRSRGQINCSPKTANSHKEFELVDGSLPLPIRMRECLGRFNHSVLLILSGKDLTADEFRETIRLDSKWQKLLDHKRISKYELLDADHTFSTQTWRNQVANVTSEWVKGL